MDGHCKKKEMVMKTRDGVKAESPSTPIHMDGVKAGSPSTPIQLPQTQKIGLGALVVGCVPT